MVRDFEHVHPRQTGPRGEQRLLRLGFEVAGEEEAQARRADEQGDAGVVGSVAPGSLATGTTRTRGGAPLHGVGRGPHHLPSQVSGTLPLPRVRDAYRHSRSTGRAAHERRLAGRLRQRRRADLPDAPPAQHAGEPGHMVGVEVRQDDQWNGAHPEITQAPVDGVGFGSRVDHDRPGCAAALPVQREHQRVPLPDVFSVKFSVLKPWTLRGALAGVARPGSDIQPVTGGWDYPQRRGRGRSLSGLLQMEHGPNMSPNSRTRCC